MIGDGRVIILLKFIDLACIAFSRIQEISSHKNISDSPLRGYRIYIRIGPCDRLLLWLIGLRTEIGVKLFAILALRCPYSPPSMKAGL